eukprot:6213139-Pleurochrysis_carterae.AAC.1
MACVLAERSRSALGSFAPVRAWPTSPRRTPASKPPHRRTSPPPVYTPNEGVRSPDWATLIARSDYAVTNGGIAED